jgi:arsenate reductase
VTCQITFITYFLFVQERNSARSILAEKLLEHWGEGRFRAFSAGSQPNGKVNPYTLKTRKQLGLSIAGLQSKSWDEFATTDSALIDFVITVCDDAAGEVCPVWQGQPVTAHWAIQNPTLIHGTEEDIMAAFLKAADVLANRIKHFVAIPFDKFDKTMVKLKMDEIGQM